MKKVIICTIAVLLGLVSCKKETSVENGNFNSGNFTAKIDGVQWSASGTKEGASILGGVITISGISADNKQINITITDSVAGSYVLSQSTTSFGAYADIDSSGMYAFSTDQGKDSSQGGGLVTITEVDPVGKTISGTFSFNVFRDLDGRMKSITNGVFTKIPYLTSLPPTSNTDTLKANIDNKAWAAIHIEGMVTQGQLTILGTSADATQTIGILMPSATSAGTYQLDGSVPGYLGAYTLLAGSATNQFVSTKGTVTVTENNTVTLRIKGSFTFTASDPANPGGASHSITSGVFSVYYGQ
jgi:hypothetical protein